MIFFCIGFSSRFAEWCDAVTSRLVQCALGPADVLSLNTLEELAIATIRTRASHLVVCSRQPASGVMAALGEANRRFIAVLDEPREAVRDLVTRLGYDLVSATRAVASSCASLLRSVSMSSGLVLTARDGRDPLSAAAAIARQLDLSVARRDIENIVEQLRGAGVEPGQNDNHTWWDSLKESEQELVDGALGAYGDHFSGADFGKITWGRELFFISDEPPTEQPAPATRAVDITGRIRFLVYGPFVNLPPGSWSARVVLGFSPEAAGMAYVAEVFAGTRLTHLRVEPESEHVAEVDLHFSIDASVDHPVQIRIYNERAAFDGRLALGYVTMTPHANVSSNTRDYLTTVLSE
jgi:hypothetical protein